MLTARYAKLLPGIRINVADPGMTATDLSGGQGHSVHDGTDAIITCAIAAPGARPEPTATTTATFPGNPPSPPNPTTPH
jgi:hypothetical protein